MSELSWQWGPDPHLPGEGRARESELALQSATHRTPRLALGLHDGPPSCARQVLCSSCRAHTWGFGREQGSFSLCPHGACIRRSKKGLEKHFKVRPWQVLEERCRGIPHASQPLWKPLGRCFLKFSHLETHLTTLPSRCPRETLLGCSRALTRMPMATAPTHQQPGHNPGAPHQQETERLNYGRVESGQRSTR